MSLTTLVITGEHYIPAIGDQQLVTAAQHLIDAASSAATQRLYAGDWKRFVLWAEAHHAVVLPAHPMLVVLYLAHLAVNQKSPATIARALAAIANTHKRAGFVPPHHADSHHLIDDTLAGIRRKWGKPPSRKDAADADITALLLSGIRGDKPAELRDRALIAFGMALAARRSELVALDVADLAWGDRGVQVTFRRSKTDQEGRGVVVAVPEGRRLRPLGHLRAWLNFAGITDGPLFRPLWKDGRVRDARLSDRGVARIVQARALAVGLDPARYAGHSLRAGFITASARAGADVWDIQQVSRHKSIGVLSDYVRNARLFDNNAGEKFL